MGKSITIVILSLNIFFGARAGAEDINALAPLLGHEDGAESRENTGAAPRAETSAAQKRFYSGGWITTACGQVYASDPSSENGEMFFQANREDRQPESALQFCFDGQKVCDGGGVAYFAGENTESGDSLHRFLLSDNNYTVLTVKGTKRDGKECSDTVKIERRADKAIVELVDDPALKFQDGTLNVSGDTAQPNRLADIPAPAAGAASNGGGTASGTGGGIRWPFSIPAALGIQALIAKLKKAGPDSNRNGVADAFDGDFGRPGNMCNDFAVRACQTLKGWGYACDVVWFTLPTNERHAVVKVSTNGQSYYFEPQLNRNFGLPTPGSIYHQFSI